MSTVTRTDHDPDDAAPRFRAVPHGRARTVLVTLASLVLATGVVLAVAEALPFLDGWVLPVVLVAVTAVFLAAGRRAAASGGTGTDIPGEVVAARVLRVRGLLRQGTSLRGDVLGFLTGFLRRAVVR